jgi:hypothetical protein
MVACKTWYYVRSMAYMGTGVFDSRELVSPPGHACLSTLVGETGRARYIA